ncbi:Uncharacterized protein K02A2.6 [Stylophora pistillata]|uniref:Uncharacterized protein K02A2.6 n=1 Tax=Stylophora pistillata TaxID=50429 RepID=A0A2B4RET0_STYPI|nr:Uncharacterized protein K02A2.6 [Stylophora pistillata]
MMMRLQKYNIDVHCECGAKMYIADLLSRAYLPEVGREDVKEFELVNMTKLLPVSDQKLKSCLRRARKYIYWPGMSAEIKQQLEACEIYRTHDPSQPKETLMPHEILVRPWEKVVTDLFEFENESYLVTGDYYSNFREVDKLPDTKARTVILKLKNHFARYGCPDKVVSDNGPQFSCSEFATFARTWEFEHCAISPGNSKTNGKAKSAVKTAKQLLRKAFEASNDPYLAILDYRNTPKQGIGSSPAQRLMSRRTKTLLPTVSQLLQPQSSKPSDDRAKVVKRQQKQKWYYDRTAKDLKPLEKGDTVRMRPLRPGEKKWRKALVINKDDRRSYTVETSDGRAYRRNRVHLRKTQESPPTIQQDHGSPPSNNPMSHKHAESPEAPTTSIPSQTSPDKSSKPQPLEVNEEPPPARPSRTRRPPEHLKDYVCY